MGNTTVGIVFAVHNQSARGLSSLNRDVTMIDRSLRSLARTALGLAGVGTGLYAVRQGLMATGREAVDFEYGMARVATMLDSATERHLPRFRTEIERMSRTYGESVATLQAGAYDILSASVAPAKAMKVLEANVRAAKGGFTDTATSVRATVGILNAYALEADRAEYVTNLMAKTVKRGVITYEELAQTIGTVTSLAAVLGVDLEAVAASVATMTRAGINADVTMTSLRAILTAFMNPTEEAKRAAAELGFALDETSIRGHGLITIMERLSRANARQIEALMPNVRGMVGFAAGLKNASAAGEDLKYMLSEVNAVEEAFRREQETTKATINGLGQEWSQFKRNLGDSAPIERATGALRALLNVANTEIRVFRERDALRLDTMFKGLSAQDQESARQAFQDRFGKEFKAWSPRIRGVEEFDWTSATTPQQHSYMFQLLRWYQQKENQGLPAWMFELGVEPGPGAADSILEGRSFERIRPTAAPETAAAIELPRPEKLDELIAKLARENELIQMSAEERARAAAIDQARAALERDIAAGVEISEHETATLLQTVGDLAAEHQRLAEETKLSTIDVAAAYRRMYEDMDRMTAESYQVRRDLLRQEYEAYAGHVDNKLLLDQWYKEQSVKLEIERLQTIGGLWGGFRAGIMDMNRELLTTGRIAYDLARQFRDGVVGAINDAVFRAEDLGDALEQVGLRLLEYWMTEQLYKPLVTEGMNIGTTFLTNLATSFFGGLAGGGGGGGNVGNQFDPGPGLGNARGNAFDSTGLIRFARGTVVDRPTVFPFARGTGLMGEAGPEGILPLDRDSQGRLGVHATAAGGGRMEALLGQILAAVQQRQPIQLNAQIVDNRDVVTRARMESREGEQWTMYHVGRNQ